MLVVDKFPLVRAAIATIIRSIVPRCEIHELPSIQKTAADKVHNIDLLVFGVDASAPTASLETLTALRSARPRLSVVAITSIGHRNFAAKIADLGVSALIYKTADLGQVTELLKTAIEDAPWFVNEKAVSLKICDRSFTPPMAKVLLGIQMGKTNKEIAKSIGRTEATVKCHLTNIYRVLGVSNRTQAALMAKSSIPVCSPR